MFTVRFPRPQYDSKAGGNYIGTTGIEVGIGDPISLSPINTKGDVSQSCEIVVAREAIPELVAALLNSYHRRFGAFEIAAGKFATENGEPLVFENPGKVYDWAHAKTGQPFGIVNPVEGQIYEPRLIDPVTPETVIRAGAAG